MAAVKKGSKASEHGRGNTGTGSFPSGRGGRCSTARPPRDGSRRGKATERARTAPVIGRSGNGKKPSRAVTEHGRRSIGAGNRGSNPQAHRTDGTRAAVPKELRDTNEIRTAPIIPALTSDMPLPELLVPCGSEEALRAAVEGGADAVYLGGRMLNARMNAKNFDDSALARAVSYCHSRGVRLYVTLNTLVYDRELKAAAEYAEMLYRIGVDALIVADAGLCALLREYLPDMELHASTQMSAHGLEATQRLAQLGFSRVVPAREMSLYDIAELCRNTPIQTEIFVHGALCVCRSGQCLFSSLVGGRSGNRGECAQPCRLPYNHGYPLSLKDLCLAEHITSLIACGVSSLKIEGRMKSPSYIRGVARIYRRLLDERRNATAEELKTLRELFSRDGFTDGYFTDRVDGRMLGVRTERDKDASAAAAEREKNKADRSDTSRTAQDIIDIGDRLAGAVMPLSETAAVKCLTDRFPEQKKRNTARFLRADQITDRAREYFEIIALPADEFVRSGGGGANAVVMPTAVFDSERGSVLSLLIEAHALGARYCYVGNIGHISLALDAGFELLGDFRLNITGSASALLYDRLAPFGGYILSPELILPQMRDVRAKKSVIVYGRIPLMSLECRTGEDSLTDRRGAVFPIREDEHIDGIRTRETVYNSCPLWMADRLRELAAAGVKDMHFIFSVEDARRCDEVIEAYTRGTPPMNGMAVRRIR